MQNNVTQIDRDAAANWLQSIDGDGLEYAAIRSGECDNLEIVQAFANHRQPPASDFMVYLGIKQVRHYLEGRFSVQLHDGRLGIGATVSEALEAAQNPNATNVNEVKA